MRERVSLYRYTAGLVRASEIFVIDPNLFNDGTRSPAGGSQPGYSYLLAPLGNVFPVRMIEVLGKDRVDPCPNGAMLNNSLNAEIVGWTITLIQPDAQVILDAVPLLTFARTVGGNNAEMPIYFDADTVIDPRQSYVTAPPDDGTKLQTGIVIKVWFA